MNLLFFGGKITFKIYLSRFAPKRVTGMEQKNTLLILVFSAITTFSLPILFTIASGLHQV